LLIYYEKVKNNFILSYLSYLLDYLFFCFRNGRI